MEYISVTLLNNFIHNSLAAEQLLQEVVVFGEVSGYKIQGAHAYFTLKDEGAQIPCNCFNYIKTERAKDGDGIIVYGNVDYYVKGGRLSLNVKRIVPVGRGLQAIKLEELKQKLAAEGLFSDMYKKPIPQYPIDVCVLTSKTGAVIHDICRTVRRKNKIQNIKLYDVRVQGDGADLDIVQALEKVDELGFDCIIIARGGGSYEDLFVFNSEKLARAIFKAKTPIISGVGHESDFTICDMVADVRAATPTAAAELVAFDTEELKNYFLDSVTSFKDKLEQTVKIRKEKLTVYGNNFSLAAKLLLQKKASQLNQGAMLLTEKGKGFLTAKQNKLTSVIDLLNGVNPTNILKKGFFKVNAESADVNDLKVGDEITISGLKQIAKATVTDVKNKEKL